MTHVRSSLSVAWSPPNFGGFKVNVDAAMRPEGYVVASVCRDSAGTILGASLSRGISTDPLVGEARGVLFDLHSALALGLPLVLIEADKSLVVDALQGLSSPSPWIIAVTQHAQHNNQTHRKLLEPPLTLLGQEVVQGRSARHHHHSSSHSSPSKLFVFGDSYSDTGNTNKSQASWKYPYGITFPGKPAGRFSTGRVLTDFVAKFIGVRSPIPYRWRKYGIPLLRYGMNFAYGGTGVFDTINTGPNMTTQIDLLECLVKDGVFTIRDLESSVSLVTVVGNDYNTYQIRNGSAQGWESFITSLVNQITTNLKRIHGLGVKKVAVNALQPLGCLPSFTATFSFHKCNETINSLVSFHNLFLQQAVAKLNNETKDSPFVILDLYDSFMSILNSQGSIKFVNPLKPCCFGISSEYSCGSEDESGARKYTLCEDPESAFFWDSLHPTQKGWSAVYSALQASTLRQL